MLGDRSWYLLLTQTEAEVGTHLFLIWNLGLGSARLIWDPVHFLLLLREAFWVFVISSCLMLRYGHTLTYLLHVWPLPASPPRLLVLPALLSPSSMGRFQLLLRATSLLQGLLHKLLFLFILFTFWPH